MDLTGLSCANASLLDEATAAAEAMHMSHGIAKNRSDRFFVSDACLPQTIAVVRTRADAVGIEVEVGDHRAGLPEGPFFGVLLQYPETGGAVPDYRGIVEQAHAQGAVVTVAADLLSLVLLTPPGEFGADIAVGSSQRFGVPLGYGGPHAAYFATHERYRRAMPGRIVGVSIDSRGRQALRLALQTREQHIRREKATSNICTAQVLLGVIAGMYAVYHGPEGLARIARRTHRLTDILVAGLARLGFEIENESWFDTLTVRAPGGADAILKRAEVRGLQPAADRRRPPRHRLRRDHRARRYRGGVACVRRRRARLRRGLAGGRGPLRPACGARAARVPSSSTRCSTSTTPRPSCCATCGASRART